VLQLEESRKETDKAAAEFVLDSIDAESDRKEITMFPKGTRSSGEIRMGVFDYFEVEGLPVIVDRFEGVAWEWSRGRWRQAPHLVEQSYKAGERLKAEAFVEAYPYAAIELLER